MIITAHITRNAPSVEVIEGDGKVVRAELTSLGIRGEPGPPGMDIDASTRIMLVNGPDVPASGSGLNLTLPIAKATWRDSADLLDLTNPNEPRIIEEGLYAFNLAVLASGQSATADTAWVGMDIDGNDFGDLPGWDHYQDFHFVLQTDDGTNPCGSGCVVGWCPAGSLVDMHLVTAATDVGFKVQGTIQQVRGFASPIDADEDFDSRENFEEVSGDPVSVPVGGRDLPVTEWGDGALLLDMTAPTRPTVVSDGLYAVTCLVDIDGAFDEPSNGLYIVLHLDFDDLDAIAAETINKLSPGNGDKTTVTLSCTAPIPAGGTIRVQVQNSDGNSHTCAVQEMAVQRIAAGAAPGGSTGDAQPPTIVQHGAPTAGIPLTWGVWWNAFPPTAGTVRLTFRGDETELIDVTQDIAVWIAALEALPSIGAGNIILEPNGGSTNLITDNEVDFRFVGDLLFQVPPEDVPTISEDNTDGDNVAEIWNGTGVPQNPLTAELAQQLLDLDEPAGYECVDVTDGALTWEKRWPATGTEGAEGPAGPTGPTGPAGPGSTPLAVFQFAPDPVDVANIGTAWGNVAGVVAISPITIPASGRFRATLYGYLKGGGSDGTVYFMMNDYSTGLIKYGPTVAVPLLAGERKLFTAQILVDDHDAGEVTPTLNIQVCSDVTGITWRSFDPGGFRNPSTPPDVATEGGPTLILVEVA